MSGHLGKEPEEWEIVRQGRDIVERTSHMAQDVRMYRDIINLAPNKETQMKHNKYIHKTGAEMLKIQSSIHQPTAAETALAKKLRGKPKLQRRDIKVADMDDGGHMIAIDLEWDTSTWGDTELQSGVETLISVFESKCSQDKREQAVRMLTKLLERHEVCVRTMRQNVQPIMNRALSRRLVGGATIAALNLLYVLHICRHNFSYELSNANYINLFFDMLLIEAKLAATLIQHTFRTYREMKQAKYRTLGDLARGWGTQMEADRARRRSILLRSGELRCKWRLMHYAQRKSEQSILYGIRGPVHIQMKFTVLGLETIEHLVSRKCKELVHQNREDALYCNSTILLASFVSATRGKMSQPAIRILYHMSLSPHSIHIMLHSGCVSACLRYIKYHRQHTDNFEKASMVEALGIIGRLARHAAGLERAKAGYGFKVNQSTYCDDFEPAQINYQTLLSEYGPDQELDNYRQFLGTYPLACELSDIILNVRDIPVVKEALMDMYLLACSSCFTVVLQVLVQSAGLLLLKYIDFFESEKGEQSILGDIALCTLVQLNTHEPSRQGLVSSGIVGLLDPLVLEDFFFPRMSYKRAVFVLITLCRIDEWRAYTPQSLLQDVSMSKTLTVLMYMDLMKTIKQPPPDGFMEGFSELVLLDSHEPMVDELSELAYSIGVVKICNFFTCPMNSKHFSTLPWDMASAGCAIISALVSNTKSSASALSTTAVRYLGQCLFWGYSEICNKEMSESKALLYLSGCNAAADALAVLCQAGKIDLSKAQCVVTGIRESHAAQAANYFLNTFSNSVNMLLPDKTKSLQDHVALTSVKFLERYTCCLLAVRSQCGDEALAELAQTIGKATCRVLGQIQRAFGTTPRTTRILDDLCQLLTRLTEAPAGTAAAFRGWNLCDALVLHLPTPLNIVGEILTEETIYKNGLRELPRSVFDVMSSLCKTEQGKAISLSEGFLRRALDRIALTTPHLEGEDVLMYRRERTEAGYIEEIDPNRLDVASCLKLVALSANYNSPKFGEANQMILHPNFRIVECCANILNSQACPRNDPAYLAALKVLRYLSKDSISTFDLFKQFNIIEIFRKEVRKVDKIPLDGIADIVDFTYNVAIGMRGPHVRKDLPRMRESLTKIARIHFRLGQAVADVQWAISKNHEDPKDDILVEGPVHSEEIEELLRLSAEEEKAKQSRPHSRTGTYEACGVSSCGSLCSPIVTCKHGDYMNPDQETKIQELAKISRNTDVMEVSKESARDPALKKELHRRKVISGFIEPEEKTITLPRFDTPTRSKSSPSKYDTGRFSPSGTDKSSITGTQPIWKSPVSTKKKASRKRSNHIPQVIPSIDVSDLPQLLSTKPPRPP